MKFLLPLLVLSVFLITSCNKEQQLINDVAGAWEFATVAYETETGDLLPVDTEGVTLSFASCKGNDRQDGNCDLQLTLASGEVIPLQYNAFKAETNGLPTLRITGAVAAPAEFMGTRLGQILIGSFGHKISGNLLEVVDFENSTSRVIDQTRVVNGSFTLRRP